MKSNFEHIVAPGEPLVSVIMPVYNGAPFLSRAVRSVLSQTYTKLELLAVDDGSTDESIRLLRQIDDPRLKVLSKKNGGPGSARNLGIENSEGEFIALIDQDDEWLPMKLHNQLKLVRAGNYDFVYCDAAMRNASSGCEVICSEVHRPHTGNVIKHLFRGNFIVSVTVIFRKSVLRAFGGFSERQEHFGIDDYELWLRLAREFYFGYVPEVLARRYVHEENYSVKNVNPILKLSLRLRKEIAARNPDIFDNRDVSRAFLDKIPSFLYLRDFKKAAWCAATSLRYDPRVVRDLYDLAAKSLRKLTRNAG